jgi:uncharacterized protein
MNLNTSTGQKYYPTEFHAIEGNGLSLVFDVNNFNVIELENLELKILKTLSSHPQHKDELERSISDVSPGDIEQALEELASVNMISTTPIETMSMNEMRAVNLNLLEKYKNENLRHIFLNVTHRCTLDCGYCYGDGGTYFGSEVDLSLDSAKDAVDFLLSASGDSKECNITFFGGEPLLNFERIKEVVDYSRERAAQFDKKVHYCITTNGTLLRDEIIDYLIEERFAVTFSIDGPKKIQDINRPFKGDSNKSCYDAIYPSIKKFLKKAEENELPVFFRATVTAPSIENLEEVFTYLYTLVGDNKFFFDYYETDGNGPSHLVIDDTLLQTFRQKLRHSIEPIKEELLQKIKKKTLAEELGEKFDNTAYRNKLALFFERPFNFLVKKNKRNHHCTSPGVTCVGVSAEGDIFPCHRFVGYKETRLGNVKDGYDRDSWLKTFSRANIYNSSRCRTCWARYYCGGNCPAVNYFVNSDLLLNDGIESEPVHCRVTKIIFEEAILLFNSICSHLNADE